MSDYGISVHPSVDEPKHQGFSHVRITRRIHVNQEPYSPQIMLDADLDGTISIIFIPSLGYGEKIGGVHHPDRPILGYASEMRWMLTEVLPKELHQRLDLDDAQIALVVESFKLALRLTIEDITAPTLPNPAYKRTQQALIMDLSDPRVPEGI